MNSKEVIAVVAGLLLVGVAYFLIQKDDSASWLGWVFGLAGLSFVAKGIGLDPW